ncbi:MAG: hypothetical protein ABI140_21185 [Jatrophihabitantaceae bacterium]
MSGAAVALMGLAAPAEAAGTVSVPADCAVTTTAVYSSITFHLTCSGRPAGEQWQIVISCNPRGVNGSDWYYYGNIVTGNGTSNAPCTMNSPAGYADVSFNNSGVLPPGRYA